MKTLHHVAIAVTDLDAAEEIYRNLLQLEWIGREEVAGQKVMTSIFQVAQSRIELISPTAHDSPIASFLQKKGPGLHHICFEVDDIKAEISRLKRGGARLLNETPVPGVGGTRVAFLHPRSTAGVLIELVEKT